MNCSLSGLVNGKYVHLSELSPEKFGIIFLGARVMLIHTVVHFPSKGSIFTDFLGVNRIL
jgi:hypothetical protein